MEMSKEHLQAAREIVLLSLEEQYKRSIYTRARNLSIKDLIKRRAKELKNLTNKNRKILMEQWKFRPNIDYLPEDQIIKIATNYIEYKEYQAQRRRELYKRKKEEAQRRCQPPTLS